MKNYILKFKNIYFVILTAILFIPNIVFACQGGFNSERAEQVYFWWTSFSNLLILVLLPVTSILVFIFFKNKNKKRLLIIYILLSLLCPVALVRTIDLFQDKYYEYGYKKLEVEREKVNEECYDSLYKIEERKFFSCGGIIIICRQNLSQNVIETIFSN